MPFAKDNVILTTWFICKRAGPVKRVQGIESGFALTPLSFSFIFTTYGNHE